MFKIFDEVDLDDYYYYSGGSDDDKDSSKPENKYKGDVDDFKLGVAGGIQKERCCTDIPCLVLYWLFMGAMVYATNYGYKNGQYHRLTAPLDAQNNFCGFDAYADYPKMMLTTFELEDLISPFDILKSGVCIKTCPTESGKTLAEGTDCMGNSKRACSVRTTYKSIDVFDFCIPASKDALSEAEWAVYESAKQEMKDSAAGSIFSDLYNSSRAIYICFGLALVWSLIFIYLLSWFAE